MAKKLELAQSLWEIPTFFVCGALVLETHFPFLRSGQKLPPNFLAPLCGAALEIIPRKRYNGFIFYIKEQRNMKITPSASSENRLICATLFAFFVSGASSVLMGNLMPFLREIYGVDCSRAGLGESCVCFYHRVSSFLHRATENRTADGGLDGSRLRHHRLWNRRRSTAERCLSDGSRLCPMTSPAVLPPSAVRLCPTAI